MPISQLGAINTTALLVPDVYVQIVPPQAVFLNGVPSNIMGVVGTATWGKKNSQVTIANMADYSREFGPIVARKFDLGTLTAAAVLQGANDFRAVRVTDGTDAAATIVLTDDATLTQITYTAVCTGSLGNQIKVTHAAGSNSTNSAPTFKVSVSLPGRVTETFDNIGGVDEAVWANIAKAINLGQSGLRGPSEIITAVVPTSNASDVAPTLGLISTLASGTDGADGADAQDLLGADSSTRTGLYALRGSKASVIALADCDDTTTWSNQVAYGLNEGSYMILTGPAGQSISAAISAKSTAGIDTPWAKLMLGDWVYFNDTVNGQQRLISPQGYALGRLGNLAPQESSLNKPIFGLIGTQRSAANQSYSSAELQQLIAAGIEVICNPAPGGTYFACRSGHNTSSNPVTNGDVYTRMTNYIAATINAGMGLFIGKIHTPAQQREAKATLDNFFSNMEQQGQIGTTDGTPAFETILAPANNPRSRVALGYMQADCKVVYFGIIEKLLINVEGGASVQITRQDVTFA